MMADVVTGKMYDFPFGGEQFYTLDLKYGVKSSLVSAKWVDTETDTCFAEELWWNGVRFTSSGKRVLGSSSRCDS